MQRDLIEGFKVSPQQKRLWLQYFQQSSVAQCVVELNGDLQSEVLQEALRRVLDQHEILRTTFHTLRGMEVPLQVILETPNYSWREVSIGEVSVAELLQEEAPIDFENGLLLSCTLVFATPRQHFLIINLPALCADAQSLRILVKELGESYRACLGNEERAYDVVQYADFSTWQNELLEGADGEFRREFWRLQINAAAHPLALPNEVTEVPPAQGRLSSFRFELGKDVTTKLNELGRERNVSTSVLLLACWNVLLWRLTRRVELSIRFLFDGRRMETLQDAIGLYAQYLPIASHLDDNLQFDELVEQLEKSVNVAAGWQQYFDWSQERKANDDDPVSLPVAFSYTEKPEPFSIEGLRFSLIESRAVLDRFKLELRCVDADNTLDLELRSDVSVYPAEFIERVAESFAVVLRTVVDKPASLIGELDLLGNTERQLLVEWNETEQAYERETTVPELFERQVSLMPEVIAVVDDEQQLSYRELETRANQLARYLRRYGVGPESVVGVFLERGVEAVVALLGIMKAGGAYVPLDPSYPAERVAWMLADAGVAVVVTNEQLARALPAQVGQLVLVDQEAAAIAAEEGLSIESGVGAENLAYVIYTSGSTGRPKGVMICHRSVSHLVTALERRIYAGHENLRRVGLNAPLTFDGSVKQLVQLLQGRTLVLVPEAARADGEALVEFIEEREIEALDCTPGQLRLLQAAGLGERCASLTAVLVGGEAVSAAVWEEGAVDGGRRYYNVYGPTECTVDATVGEFESGVVHIGRLLANVHGYVLERSGTGQLAQLAPIGVAGELYLGGAGLARGYLRRPELTAQRFIPDEYSGKAGARLYRTGDLARYLPSGKIEFLGRVDEQVKVRGYRIEPGEVEAVLCEQPSVAAAVVIAREDEPGDKRLVAYVVPRRKSEAVIDEHTRYQLPNGMAIVHQNKNETDYLYQEIFEKQTYIKHGIRLFEDSCVFDVGANIGLFTLFVRRCCPHARIYAFEPIKPIFDSLRINAELYGSGIHLRQIGLSDQNTTDEFTFYSRYTMMSGLRAYAKPQDEVDLIKRFLENEASEGETEARELLDHADELLKGRFESEVLASRLRRLSDVIREEGIERIDLLKIDVQRAELDVLRGIEDEHWARIEQVVMEVHDDPAGESKGRTREITRLLEKQGFSAVVEQDELLEGTDRYNLYAIRRHAIELNHRVECNPSRASLPLPEPAIFSTAELRRSLKERLPDYMAPAAIVPLKQLPLTANGKVDRQALPAPEASGDGDDKYEKPRTPIEELLAGVWAEVLRVDRVGVRASFFELGGHSLLATQLISRVREVFGVNLPLRSLFDTPTVEGFARNIEEALKAGIGDAVPKLERVDRDGDLPLSFAQQRLWFLNELDPGNPFYNGTSAVSLEGKLNVEALQLTLDEIVRRHEVLRTTFVSRNGQPVQIIAPELSINIPIIESTGEQNAETQKLALEDARRPFDLSAGPLLRATLVRHNEQKHVVILTMHHIISDDWSAGVLFDEVSALYTAFSKGEPSPLPELPIQYADYAAWQRNWLQGEVLERQLEYWRRQLGPELPALELPADRQRPPVSSFRGAHQFFNLPAELKRKLEALSRSEGCTLFMTLLAGLQTLLMRYSGQHDIVVGTANAGRNRAEIEPLIGFFINPLALRTDLSGAPTFRELLGRVREVTLAAYAHQDVPFEKLVEALMPERDSSRAPLFQVALVMQTASLKEAELPGLALSIVGVDNGTTPLDLRLVVSEQDGGLYCKLEYSSDLFDTVTIQRLLNHYQQVLTAAVENPGSAVGELPLLNERERRQLLTEWNHAESPYDRRTIHELFERQVLLTPAAIAVVGDNQQLSYRELETRANQLAHYLRRYGVGPESLVGMFLERGIEAVVALLGIMKAGGAYVPLDPSYPAERVAWMLADAGVAVVVTNETLAEELPAQVGQLVLVDEEAAAIATEEGTRIESGAGAENLAYVIYTSGSTGRPKGVMVAHGGVCNLAAAQAQVFGVNTDSRVLQFASLSFDVSIGDVVTTLLSGATLYLLPPALMPGAALTEFLAEHAITVFELPASSLTAMPFKDLPNLKTLISGGEACSRELAEKWSEGRRFFNAYGPTETTVCATVGEWLAGMSRPDIGRPLVNVSSYIVERGEYWQPAPVGVPGELYIGGDGLARGYLNRPELTAEKFLPDPFSTTPGARLYRTGDLARFLPGGNIEFLGRVDEQVKVRGVRIEPGEVEAALREHGTVAEAVVMAREDEVGEKRLVAYVVGKDGEAVASSSELRRHLQERLPEYLVPTVFLALQEIPLTANGKIDRRRLPAPAAGVREEEYAEPRTPVEELLAGVWAEVLRVERVGVRDDFFELGGHSLLATQVISRVREVFGVELALRSLFETPTVEGLGRSIEEVLKAGADDRAPKLERVTREEELPLSFAQQRLWFIDQFEPGATTYNVLIAARLTGTLQTSVLYESLNEVVKRHEVLRTVFKTIDGQASQIILPAANIGISEIDLSHLPAVEQEVQIQERAREEANSPFDLATGPLLRVTLIRLNNKEHVVFFTMHHIAGDGWSIGLLIREVSTLYSAFSKGELSPLPELPIQYADYAVWQRNWLRGEVLEQQLDYWRRQLGSELLGLALPVDRPRPPVQSFRGARQVFTLPAELKTKLEALSRSEGCTLFMTLLAGFQTLLMRYSGQSEIVVGTPIAGRTRREVEGLIGFFVNTLALRTDLSGALTFRELLGRVREVTLGAYAHQDVPFEKLVEELQPERSLSRTPLFQVMFSLQNAPAEALELPDLTLHLLEPNIDVAKFDLTLDIVEMESALRGALEYSSDLFDEATIQRMLNHFRAVLVAMVENPDITIGEVQLLDPQEQQQVLVEWNHAESHYDHKTTIPELFERQAALTPEAIAIVGDEQQLSYRELEIRANQLARYLRRYGVGPESLVGVFLERGVEAVVALLGIMKAGGAYVPLDPSYPAERVTWMLADAGVAVVVTNEVLAKVLPAQVGQVVLVDREAAAIAAEEETRIESGLGAENLAYVIYTSGSTGQPKGVMVAHGSICNRLLWARQTFSLNDSERVLQRTSLSFDVSVEEVFAPLVCGGRVVLAQHDKEDDLTYLIELMNKQQVTFIEIVPSLLQALLEEVTIEDCSSLRNVCCGGEAMSAGLRDRFFERMRARLFNMYGPTENAIDATAYECERQRPQTVPIGRVLPNVRGYVVERSGTGQLVPIGVAGELYLGGAGLARGYLRRPELTAERFIPDEYSGEAGARLYRTGDLVRYQREGQLEFLGRADEQVKVRGYRIEPGEIEAVLCEQPSVATAVVIAREDEPGRRRLVAYLVAAAGLEVPEAKQLREALSERLPDYMIPSHFVKLDKLPLTANGKLDRRALPAPQSAGAGERVAPETETERLLCQVWAEVLGRATVGVTDNFFELGGDSILSIQIVARANRAGVRLTPKDLFRYQTVRELAGAVTQGVAEETGVPGEQGVLQGSVPLTPIQRDFFEQQLPARHHYNQAVLLEVKAGSDCSKLEEVLAAVLRQHDALRLRFAAAEDDGGWRQWYAGEEAVELSRYDLSGLSESERTAELGRTAERLQRELNLEHGPVMRAAYYDYGAGRAGRLLLLAHHLVVDGVSWRVLLGDWVRAHEQVVRGEALELGAKSCSYRQWSERLAELGRDGAHLDEAEYWLGECAAARRSLPVDDEGGSRREQDAGAVVRRVSATVTRRLLTGAVEGYRAHVQELLLAGLGRVLSEWVGAEEVAVALEGHGREQEWVGLDVSQTVGWFTTVYPVAVGRRRGESRGETVRRMKERLRAIPHGGLGYGVLRYLSGDDQLQEQLRETGKAAVSFNYLGQFDGVISGGGGWYEAAAEYGGELRDGAGEREYELDVSGRVLGGELELRWAYSGERYRAETIERLAERYVEELEALAAEGAAEGNGSMVATAMVPSDFPDANLSQKDLDELLTQLGAAG